MVARLMIFIQAEDGIRDYKVTGVQTCALPILRRCSWVPGLAPRRSPGKTGRVSEVHRSRQLPQRVIPEAAKQLSGTQEQIGRASCREREKTSEEDAQSSKNTEQNHTVQNIA